MKYKLLLSLLVAGALTSCDSESSSSSNSNTNTAGGTSTPAPTNPTPTNNNGATNCLEGSTICYTGTQTSTSSVTTPIALTTTTETSFDIEVEFLAGGITNTNGSVTVDSISSSLTGSLPGAGVTTPINDARGTYVCDTNNANLLSATVIEDGITTTYTLTYTSDTAGTFEATVTGERDGAAFDATSAGTFEMK